MLDKKYLDEILTDTEQQKVANFVMDEVQFEAIKKVLLFSVYNSGVIVKGKKQDYMHNPALVMASNPKMTDKELADYVRACYQGLNAIELGFSDLMRYKLEEMPKNLVNPAR